MLPTDMTLSPALGLILLVVMLFLGRAFRENWKAQAEGWERRAWVYGALVVVAFLPIAFLPLAVP